MQSQMESKMNGLQESFLRKLERKEKKKKKRARRKRKAVAKGAEEGCRGQ